MSHLLKAKLFSVKPEFAVTNLFDTRPNCEYWAFKNSNIFSHDQIFFLTTKYYNFNA